MSLNFYCNFEGDFELGFKGPSLKTQANLAYESKGYENSHEKGSHMQQYLSLLMGSSPSLRV